MIQIRRVLCPVDFSAPSLRALQHGIRARRASGIEEEARILAVRRRVTRRNQHPALEGGRGCLVAVHVRERPELHRAQHRVSRALRDHRVDQREDGIALSKLIVHALDPENGGGR